MEKYHGDSNENYKRKAGQEFDEIEHKADGIVVKFVAIVIFVVIVCMYFWHKV